MVRGLLLGLGWGVLTVTVVGTSLSLVVGENIKAPVLADQQTDTPPKAGDTAPADIADGSVQAPDQQALAPLTDTAEISTVTPTAPNVSGDAQSSDGGDAAMVSSPDVTVVAPQGGNEETTDQTTDMAAVMPDVTPDPVAQSQNAALPTPTTEAQPKADTQSDAMVAPVDQEGPKADASKAGDAPDTRMAGLPKAQMPDVVDMPTDTPTAPILETEPKADDRFEQARVSVPKIRNLAPNVRTNRLPSIGDSGVAVETAQQAAPAEDLGALKSFAMPFENPDAKPMFSAILIDDETQKISDDILSNLPFALSFAIDAAREDATNVAARYRAAGFEVLMLTNLPKGASAADIETTFGAYIRAIPEAIGVLDMGANGFLSGPTAATQIAGIMNDGGYGLVTPSKGLNSAQKAAKREGVPAVLLFRELDADNENASTIRRYLDRAAFRAAQEGSVIVLGHTRPDTVEALVEWAVEDRAASLAIAPVSAVLLAQ